MRIESDQMKTLAALLAIALACGAVIWFPAHMRSMKLATQMSAARNAIQTAGHADTDLARLQRVIERMESELDSSDKQVPGQPEIADLMRQFNRTLKNRDVSNLRLQHAKEFIGADYNIVPIEISFRGSFMDAFIFLEQIESMRRLIRVEAIHVEGKDKSNELDITFSLSAFYVPTDGTDDTQVSLHSDHRIRLSLGGPVQ